MKLLIVLILLLVLAGAAIYLYTKKGNYNPKQGSEESNPIKDTNKDKHQELN